MADPMNPMMADPTQTEPAGYTIEVRVSGAGDISVSVEPASAEMAEGQTNEDAQAVPNIREAIKVILDIYQNQGAVPDTGGDDAMAAGYKPGI